MRASLGAALLAVTLYGCGSDVTVPPPPPPHSAGPPIMVAVSSNASLRRSGSAQVTVTVARNMTSIVPVDLNISGLSSGITAAFEPASVPATATTSILTLSAGAAAPTGTVFATLCGNAPGVSGSCTQLLVTVSP